MSKLRLIIGLCLLLTLMGKSSSVWSQEVHHAPTVEQCRADQRVWLAKLEGNGAAETSYNELTSWAGEMMECMQVDQGFHNQYDNTLSEAQVAQGMRTFKFIYRHHLWEEFMAEDAQGKGRRDHARP